MAEEEEATETTQKGSGKRLPPRKWEELIHLYELGEHTADELAAIYGLNPSYLKGRLSKLGIKKGTKAQEHADKIRESLHRKALDEASMLAERISETKERHYKYIDSMSKLAWSEVARAIQTKRPLATTMPTLKAIEKAVSIFRNTREEAYELLGLNDANHIPTDLPDLTVRELTAEEVEKMRSRDASKDENLVGGDYGDGDFDIDTDDFDLDTEEDDPSAE